MVSARSFTSNKVKMSKQFPDRTVPCPMKIINCASEVFEFVSEITFHKSDPVLSITEVKAVLVFKVVMKKCFLQMVKLLVEANN